MNKRETTSYYVPSSVHADNDFEKQVLRKIILPSN
jgi:hypothetical protein